MNLPLQINENLVIPADLIKVSAVRSSGPGGQNVNKVATCIELRFNAIHCSELPQAAIQRLLETAKNRLDSDGNIIVTSQKYREQYRNLIDAYGKLKSMIVRALKPPKTRRPTAPTRASKERRLTGKKQQGSKKANRRRPIIFDEE